MDKGNKRIARGRMRFAIVVAMCAVALFALPAFAHASYTNVFPAEGATVNPAVSIGALFTGAEAYTPDEIAAASIMDGATSIPATVKTAADGALGTWNIVYSAPDVNGKVTATWSWTAGAMSAEQASVFGSASGLALGAHTITISLGGETSTAHVTVVAATDGGNGGGGTPAAAEPCLASGCHGTAAPWDNEYDGHAGGSSCGYCHFAGGVGPDPDVVHADVHAAIDKTDSTSAGCIGCHGGNYLHLFAGDGVTEFEPDEHQGCSCHDFGLATAPKECVDCHAGTHGPHGFDGTASGHSTATYGKKGAFSLFDGSTGNPLIKDSRNETVTASWPFPTKNVFWAAGATDAPAGAKLGLTKDDTLLCTDCHTEFSDGGPHGAADAWGLDPAYDGAYEDAFLWAGPLPTVTASGVTYTTGTTISSGIAKYTPDPAGRELGDFALATPVGVGQFEPTGASIVAGNDVICAKCHDLYNDNTGMIGWSNYGHEHHDTQPVANMALFQGSDGTTMVAETTPAALPAPVTKPVSASLGRETGGACRNCHVAVPHGWKRPRLIVYSTDPEPFNIESMAEPEVGGAIGQMNLLGYTKTNIVQSTGTNWLKTDVTADSGTNVWSSSQCNACGSEHTSFQGTGVDGAWK